MIFTTVQEAEHLAKKKIRRGTFNWLNSGAEDGETYQNNSEELKKIKIIPKILVKNKNTNIKNKFYGLSLDHPIILSPMGHQTQFEKNGEMSVAAALNKKNILGFFSTQGRIGFKDLKIQNKNSNIVWQIFPFGDKSWIEKEI